MPVSISEAKQKMRLNIGKVAEVYYFLQPCVMTALKEIILSPEAKEALKTASTTYFELWQENYSDRYFDVATFLQLNSQLDLSFKTYYMAWKGYETFKDLYADPAVTPGVFHSTLPNSKSSLQGLFKDQGIFDLATAEEFSVLQEFYIHSSLYTKYLGLVNDTYIKQLKNICQIDLLADERFASLNYPNEEVYWFYPLHNLKKYIESARQIIEQLPEKK